MKVLDFIKKKIFFQKDNETNDIIEDKDFEQQSVDIDQKNNGWLSKLISFGKEKDKVVDDIVLDDLEETLISKDVGINTTCKIISRLEEVMAEKKIYVSELSHIVQQIILSMINVEEKKEEHYSSPKVIMVIGVNGVGKTTSIGKLANIYKGEGKNVVIGAADTFRAGAVSQLKIWCEKVGVKMIEEGSSPSTVAFNTVQYAIKNNFDTAIIDTAGRLQNKIGLMDELAKMKRVIKNLKNDAPNEILLVLDASTGQNIFSQLTAFVEMINVNGMIITKIDGIAKSGFIIGAIDKFKIPVKYIGTGEKINDLYCFDAKKFVEYII